MSEVAVAGTRVETCTEAARPRVLLVSDLHIPSDGGAVLERFGRLLEQARSEGERLRLFILGDLFDAYTGPKQLRVGVWREVADRLAHTAAAGVDIKVLRGNRDYMLDHCFARRAGCSVVEGGLLVELAGSQTLLLHGDELCQNDLPYQRAKRLLRHPLTRLLLRHLPLGLSLRLAEKARQKSARTIAAGDQSRFDPLRGAGLEAFARGARRLIFGHIHRPARGELQPGCEYLVLPAFDVGGVHLRGDAGGLDFVDLDGGVLRYGELRWG